MAIGRIKFFDKEQGFGVIKPDKPGSDAYVLRSALEAARIYGIKPNQRVFYQLEPHPISGRPVAGTLSIGGASSVRRVQLLVN